MNYRITRIPNFLFRLSLDNWSIIDELNSSRLRNPIARETRPVEYAAPAFRIPHSVLRALPVHIDHFDRSLPVALEYEKFRSGANSAPLTEYESFDWIKLYGTKVGRKWFHAQLTNGRRISIIPPTVT